MDLLKEKVKRFRKLGVWDLALWKASLIVFGILLAKLFPALLSFEVATLFILFIVLVAKPFYTAWIEK